MLAQAAVQHQGQVLFQPVQADGSEWDVQVVVRAFDDQPGHRFGEAHQGPQLCSVITSKPDGPSSTDRIRNARSRPFGATCIHTPLMLNDNHFFRVATTISFGFEPPDRV